MNFYKNVTTLNPTFYLHLFFGFPKIKKKLLHKRAPLK